MMIVVSSGDKKTVFLLFLPSPGMAFILERKDIMKVRKRDGKLQQFNCEKIYDAICAALNSANVTDKNHIAWEIARYKTELILNKTKIIEIETLQDLVEASL